MLVNAVVRKTGLCQLVASVVLFVEVFSSEGVLDDPLVDICVVVLRRGVVFRVLGLRLYVFLVLEIVVSG